jgi:hypothetical protein
MMNLLVGGGLFFFLEGAAAVFAVDQVRKDHDRQCHEGISSK